jgi:hypothetical protein
VRDVRTGQPVPTSVAQKGQNLTPRRDRAANFRLIKTPATWPRKPREFPRKFREFSQKTREFPANTKGAKLAFPLPNTLYFEYL